MRVQTSTCVYYSRSVRDGYIWGQVFNRYVHFSFRGNWIIFGRWSHLMPRIQSIGMLFVSWLGFGCDMANSLFDLENSRSKSLPDGKFEAAAPVATYEAAQKHKVNPVYRGDLIKHYNDVIMGAIASQITSLTIVYSTVYSGADQRKHESSASLAFVRGIHRRPVNSPHKGPVTRKMFPFDDVIMILDPDGEPEHAHILKIITVKLPGCFRETKWQSMWLPKYPE